MSRSPLNTSLLGTAQISVSETILPNISGEAHTNNLGGSLKAILMRHQGLVSALQYMTRAGVMLIPGSLEFYEVAVEGCYSASQLITFFNSTILENRWERSKGLEDYMVLFTRAISHVEVLAEKMALALGGEYRRSQLVWFVELLKAICRLVMLADRRKPTLLLHWGLFSDPDEIKLDLSHYIRWYTRPKRPQRIPADLRVASQGQIAQIPSGAHVQQTAALLKHARTFKGKRSGLVLSLAGVANTSLAASGPGFPGQRHDQPGSAHSSIGVHNYESNNREMPSDDNNSIRNDSEDSARKSCASACLTNETRENPVNASGGSYVECLTAVLGMAMPPIASTELDVDPTRNSSVPRLLPSSTAEGGVDATASNVLVHGRPVPAGTLTMTAAQLSNRIEAKHFIYLGEVLYALRPAIYAWALHSVNKIHGAAIVPAATARAAGDALGGAYFNESGPTVNASSSNASDDYSQWIPRSDQSFRRVRNQGTLWGQAKRQLQANLWPSRIISTLNKLRKGYASTPRPTGGGSGYGKNADILLATAVAMMVEVASVHLTSVGLRLARQEAATIGEPVDPRIDSQTKPNLHAFDRELQRRQLALLYYFLRSPLFDRTTMPLLEMAAKLMERIPLLGGLPASAIGLVKYLHRTHFYTSASS